MAKDIFREVTVLGDLFVGKPRAHRASVLLSVRHDPKAVPHGCEWFPDCERCRWPDCQVTQPLRYGSPKAISIRARLAGELLAGTATLDAVAWFFGVHERSVQRWRGNGGHRRGNPSRTLPQATCPEQGRSKVQGNTTRRRRSPRLPFALAVIGKRYPQTSPRPLIGAVDKVRL